MLVVGKVDRILAAPLETHRAHHLLLGRSRSRSMTGRSSLQADVKTATRLSRWPDLPSCLAGEAWHLFVTSAPLVPLPIGRLLFLHGLSIDQPLTLDGFV